MTNDERYGRRIRDLGALRVLAHTQRYAMLEHLQTHGPATATECAQVVGLSPSACSYHLRLLARHGFVEPDADRGDARERVWRAATTGWQSDPDTHDPAAAAADATLARVLVSASDDKVLAWVDAAARDEADWRAAALLSNSTIVTTAAELAGVAEAVMAVLRPYFISRRPLGSAPEGARPVHVALRLAPRPPDAPDEPPPSA